MFKLSAVLLQMKMGSDSVKMKNNSVPKCFVCAIRSSLIFCKLNTVNCGYNCNHKAIHKSKFYVSRILQALNFLCNVLITAATRKNMSEIYKNVEPKHLVNIIQISINSCVIYSDMLHIFSTKYKVEEYNGLLKILNQNILSDLTSSFSYDLLDKIKTSMQYLVLALLTYEIINTCFLFYLNWNNLNNWLNFISSEISMFSIKALFVCFVQTILIYSTLLQKFFEDLKTVLKQHEDHGFTEKLKSKQRLYMSLRKLFLLNTKYFSTSVTIVYIANAVILIICLNYLLLLYIRGRIVFDTRDYQILIRSVIVIMVKTYLCLKAEKMNELTQKALTFLLKHPLNKLDNKEALQVRKIMFEKCFIYFIYFYFLMCHIFLYFTASSVVCSTILGNEVSTLSLLFLFY